MKSAARSSNLSIFSTSRRRSRSPPQAWSRNATRSAAGRSSAASKSSSIRRQRSGFIGAHFGNHAIEPGLGPSPLASHCTWRNLQHFGGLFNAQPAEIAQLDNPALLLVNFLQRAQSLVEGDEVCGLFRGHYRYLV